MSQKNSIYMGNGGTEVSHDLNLDEKIEEPKMYRVLIHNDHYSTMDFVVEVLMKVFQMPHAQAVQVMLDVHKKGQGICGLFTYDIAASKVNQVHSMAKARQFPLKSSYEEV